MFDSQKIADTYNQIGSSFSATRPKLSDQVVSLLPTLSPGASVLDLGCGNGVLLTALSESVAYTGLDISHTLLAQAKKLHPKNNFLFADVTDQSTWQDLLIYDFIAALAVLHHLPSPDDHLKLLRNIKQHLNPADSAGRPKGVCLISVWNLNQPKFAKYRHADNPKIFSIPFHGGPKRDFYAFEQAELPSLATQVGFTNIETITTKENLYYYLA